MYPKEKIRFLVDAASTAKYSTKERAVCQAQGVKNNPQKQEIWLGMKNMKD
jgi:hypothetical protein